MHFVYILHTHTGDTYYTGESATLEERLIKHNTGYYSKSFTSKFNDWKIVFTLKCVNNIQARKIEHFIKSMKSRKFIERLILEDPSWLLSRFKPN